MHDPNAWNVAGLGSCAAMFIFVIVGVWINPRIQRWAEKPEPRSNAIDSSNYTTPLHTMHVIDVHRSRITVCSDGSIVAGCAVQGCAMSALIGRNVANAIVADEPKG